jgi:signal transduction histidine kinase
MLGRIRGSIVEMEGLIEGLLHYARMGELKPGTEIVSLDKALESALSNLQRVVEAKRATVEAGELPSVRGDVTALSLLLQNLVGNALKFHDGQPHIEVSAQRSDGEWIVTVSDDGIGIDPEHLERIFKPFERLHGKNQYEGSGLGLATCARIVEAHGGRIWADAQVGQGTRVLVAFPVAAPEAASPTTDGVELDQSVRR